MKGLLLRSAETGVMLEMISAKGELSQRIIRVVSVDEELFRAYCYTKKQLRSFKISNILSIGSIRQHRRGA